MRRPKQGDSKRAPSPYTNRNSPLIQSNSGAPESNIEEQEQSVGREEFLMGAISTMDLPAYNALSIPQGDGPSLRVGAPLRLARPLLLGREGVNVPWPALDGQDLRCGVCGSIRVADWA